MTPEHEMQAPEDDLTEIARYPNESDAHEHALVVLAMGEACTVTDEHGLQVDPDLSHRAIKELKAYDAEQTENPTSPPPLPDFHPVRWPIYALWAITLISIHLFKHHWPHSTDLFSSSNIDLIQHRQWWRALTALFFHADLNHLLGNLLSGLIFTTLVAKSIGTLRGWISILLCGSIGNLSTAFITYPEPFNSIGASTAVFAALGILSGYGLALLLHTHRKLPWLRILSPLIGGIILLSLIGGGGNTPDSLTDVLGHVLGFSAGIPAGYLNGRFKKPSRVHRIAEP